MNKYIELAKTVQEIIDSEVDWRKKRYINV
jgi:hypothetical protein